MPRLTVDLILEAHSFTNAVKLRQIDLRGYKIAMIENLGATQNQFDSIDLSDNEIRKLDNFPLLPRCVTLFLSNNRIIRIDEGVVNNLPNLHTLILTNNHLSELSDLHHLGGFRKLKCLSLMGCPVTKAANYRLFLIHLIPNLRLLDFQKIKQKEREAAIKLFGVAKKGQANGLKEAVQKAPTTMQDDGGLTPEQTELIKKAIGEADSLEEISTLERALKLGIVPENLAAAQSEPAADDKMEEDSAPTES